MKIRNGFVSNSSSSSFILLGVKMTKNSLMNNPEYKFQFDEALKQEELKLVEQWDKKLNHVDFDKHKNVYEMCKSNGVSLPKETKDFFGYGFDGKFEPRKPNEDSIYSDMIYEQKFKFPKGISTLSDDGPTYVGKILATSSDDYFENGSVSIDDFKNIIDELVNIGFDPNEIKLHYGTRAC